MTSKGHVEAAELPIAFLALPPFPAVALKAMRVMSRHDSRLRELHDLIRSDPAFSSEILRIVNSPLFPFPAQITNTLQAVMLLGFERVQSLALAIGVRVFLCDSTEVPAVRECWRHSLACAIAAETVSRAGVIDKDAAYCCGVLHDIGRLALAVTHRQAYAAFLDSARENPCDLLHRERELFGTNHCEVGKELITAWKLPERFAIVAAHHHDAPTNSTFDMLAVVRLSCALADAMGYSVGRCANALPYEELYAQLPAGQKAILPKDPKELSEKISQQMQFLEF